jgi:hypothetical protein
MNKVMNAQISATRCWSGAGAKRLRSPQKSKTTGGASPVVLEVYHEVEAGLPEGQLPPTDLAGYI